MLNHHYLPSIAWNLAFAASPVLANMLSFRMGKQKKKQEKKRKQKKQEKEPLSMAVIRDLLQAELNR